MSTNTVFFHHICLPLSMCQHHSSLLTLNVLQVLQNKQRTGDVTIITGLNASVGSAILNFSNKLKDVFSEQLGLLKGSKVTTSRHQSVGADIVILGLCPSLWAVYQLSWEGSKARGYKYTNSARGSEKVNCYLWEHEIIAPTSDNETTGHLLCIHPFVEVPIQILLVEAHRRHYGACGPIYHDVCQKIIQCILPVKRRFCTTNVSRNDCFK